MSSDDILDFHEQLNDRLSDLDANLLEKVRNHEHHDKREGRKGDDEHCVDVAGDVIVYVHDLFLNYFSWHNQHESVVLGCNFLLSGWVIIQVSQFNVKLVKQEHVLIRNPSRIVDDLNVPNSNIFGWQHRYLVKVVG